jgi:hypothetical protein
MKAKIFFAVALLALLFPGIGTVSLRAQPTDSAPILSPDDLDQLVAPIALYPDPLIALILPASTVPTDIVLANRYVQNGGDTNAIDSQNWDDSVKGLAHYPDVLQMMDENLDWTNQLGAAVLAQQADVMTAIQRQRAKAQALGNLQSTPQQEVLTDQQIIQIVPTDPQVIYVPVYDPQVVYVDRAPAVPFITFGLGLAIGAWIGGDCDWHNHGIYRGGYYRPGYGWGSANVNININNNYVWRPNPNKPKPRPPYRPGGPGSPGGGNGHLSGWNRPPGGNKPLPGKPGGPGTIKPQPKPPGNGNGNRPGGPGNRPGNDKPQIQPVPGKSPGQTRPAPSTTQPAPNRPSKPSTRPTPGFDQTRPNTKLPHHTQPSIQPAKPQPKPATPTTRPAVTKPSAPTTRPAPRLQPQNTKRPAPGPAAGSQGQRPAPQRGNPNR